MKKALLYFSFLLPFIIGCGSKSSCIHGIVIDSKTGKPISGASIQMYYEYTEQGSQKNQRPSALTDAAGEFSFSADEKHAGRISIQAIYVDGYAQPFDLDRNNRGCDDVTIKLTPFDGIIKLNIVNETGTYDSIYVRVFNKCDYKYYFSHGTSYTQPYPLTLQQGSIHTQNFVSCVGDSTSIQWKFTEIESWTNIDSFIIENSDTTFLKIIY